MQVVLGSSSRWRRDLAKQCLGTDVVLMPPDIDERAIARTLIDATPESHCATIARAKLDFLIAKATVPSIILCFDTIVFLADTILEKPANDSEARAMVGSWGRKDEEIAVFTAVACARTDPLKITETVEIARIRLIRDLTEDEVVKYFEDGICLESSGAVIVEKLIEYGVANVEGDQSVIEGLPIATVKRIVDGFKE
jgi:septum formation protein